MTGLVAGVDVEVIRRTVAWIPKSNAAASDVGKYAYATDDDTVTVVAAANVKACGRVVAWKTGFVLVDFADAMEFQKKGPHPQTCAPYRAFELWPRMRGCSYSNSFIWSSFLSSSSWLRM